MSIQLGFWCTQVIKPEKAWDLGCAFCLLPIQPVAKTMPFATFSDLQLCQSLVMSYIVHGVFGHCIALDSQADQDLLPSSAAELEEARVECAGWLCTLECKSGCSTTRKRASNPGTA